LGHEKLRERWNYIVDGADEVEGRDCLPCRHS